jgi:branched-chain amino acid transport system permease protein
MDIVRVISKKSFLVGLLLLILAALVTAPLYTSGYFVVLVSSILMYIVLAVSWALFSGPTGYLSLASAAFFGAGIYTSAIVGGGLPLPIVILLGGLVSFCLALLVGALTLRLRGTYFAIFTFGLVEILLHFTLWWEVNISGTTGRVVPSVDNTTVYYAMLVVFVVLMLTTYFIRRSKFGLALQSIGENEEAAAHSGVNVTLLKVTSFAISAFFMGAAGAVMATRWTYIDPTIAFNPLLSFMPVLMAIFGGMGQLYGPVIGAAFFTLLKEYLTTTLAKQGLGELYMLIFGIVLVAAILFLPKGVVGLIQKWWGKWGKRNSGEQLRHS